MIYNIPYQAEDQMRKTFMEMRKSLNTGLDRLHCIIQEVETSQAEITIIYKILLKLEGEYRSLSQAWQEPILKLRLIQCP